MSFDFEGSVVLELEAEVKVFQILNDSKRTKLVSVGPMAVVCTDVDDETEVNILVVPPFKLALLANLPCLKVGPLSYMFPVSLEEQYCIVLSDDTDEEDVDMLELVLETSSQFRESSEPLELSAVEIHVVEAEDVPEVNVQLKSALAEDSSSGKNITSSTPQDVVHAVETPVVTNAQKANVAKVYVAKGVSKPTTNRDSVSLTSRLFAAISPLTPAPDAKRKQTSSSLSVPMQAIAVQPKQKIVMTGLIASQEAIDNMPAPAPPSAVELAMKKALSAARSGQAIIAPVAWDAKNKASAVTHDVMDAASAASAKAVSTATSVASSIKSGGLAAKERAVEVKETIIYAKDNAAEASERAQWSLQQRTDNTTKAIQSATDSLATKIASGREYVKRHLKPSDKPVVVNPAARERLQKMKQSSARAVVVSENVVAGATAAVMSLSIQLSDGISNTRAAKAVLPSGPSGPRTQAAKDVGKAAVASFGSLYQSLQDSAFVLMDALRDSAVDVVDYKYGPDAKAATEDGLSVITDATKGYVHMNSLGVKRLAATAAKSTATDLVSDEKEKQERRALANNVNLTDIGLELFATYREATDTVNEAVLDTVRTAKDFGKESVSALVQGAISSVTRVQTPEDAANTEEEGEEEEEDVSEASGKKEGAHEKDMYVD